MTFTIQPVVLCGGSGTRLWPLSRKAFPKQFVPLIDGKSLLSLTLERVAALATKSVGAICVGSEDHRFMLREAMGDAKLGGTIILEPVARNTAAAMTMAALQAGSPDHLLLFCPSDHHIPDTAAFAAMVRSAVPCAQQGGIVTFGVMPTFPSTGYGYIEQGTNRADGGHAVARFIEKPNAQRAQELLLTGKVLWNAGIFLCSAGTLLAAMQEHAADILESCRQAMAAAKADAEFLRPGTAALEACRSESIDFAVMEHHADLAVFPFAGQWSDVGSWNAVADMVTPDAQGNRIAGQGVAIQAKNNYVYAPTRCVVVVGVDDLVIVDTPDAVLVTRRGNAELVKLVVPELERRGTTQAATHRKVLRPWGSYDSVESGNRFQVKRITVKPNGTLSLQKHFHRAEHWIVVTGTAEVTRGKDTFLLSENQSTFIPLGEVHRLHNPGKTPLEMIEVQSGSYLGEDDIVRMEDHYGRVVAITEAKKHS